MQPDPQVGDEVARVKALVENGPRLGLTWDLTLATIVDIDPTTAEVSGILDGDSEPIGLISLRGPFALGDRVWVVQVPPSGNYIVGTVYVGGDTDFGRVQMEVRRTSNQSIPSGSQENIVWNSTVTNRGGFALSASGLTVTVPRIGIYDASLQIDMGGGGGSRNFVNLDISGRPVSVRNSFASGEDIANVTAAGIPLGAGAAVVGSIFQNSGSPINLTSAVLTVTRHRDE